MTTAQDNRNLLNAEASRRNLSPEGTKLLQKIMHAESGGDQNAVATGRSSAAGLFQAISGTWNDWAPKLNLDRTDSPNGDGRFDPKQQVVFGIEFTRSNENKLKQALNRDPNAGELYLAHFAGDAGAIKILKASPDTKITELLSPDAIAANGVKVDKNGKVISKGVRLRLKDGSEKLFKDFTAGDIQNWAARKMDQPENYESMSTDERSKYRKEHNISDDTPDALGDMVMTIIGKLIASLFEGMSSIAKMFTGDVPSGTTPPAQNTPAGTVVAGRTSNTPAG